MMLLDTLRRRRLEKTRRPATPGDPLAGFTWRDWADLPPFHPSADIDFRSR